MASDAVIEVKGISKRFGGLAAVDDCSLQVERGSITGLIGPNGAGKTTLFNIVAGNIAPDAGQVIFDGEDITGLPPHQLFARGMLRTFQIAKECSGMTALENLMMVPGDQPGESLLNTWLRPGLVASREREVKEKALEVIEFLKLGHVRNELAGNLSGGQKKLLELGRTMMVDAKVVLLDEVAAGINRTLFNDLASNIERMNKELGYTFFMIEHDMDLIGRLCDPVIVMAQGSKIAEGPLDELRQNPEIIEAYFGAELEVAFVSLISLEHVVAGYGGAPILNGVDIDIEASDIGVIVGPNGAGKSTTLKAIFGLLKVSSGAVRFKGEEIANSLPDKLVPMGLSFVPQEHNVFTSMTVEENLEMGAFIRRDDFSGTLAEVYEMFPPLKEKRYQNAGELSGGQRQMVAMGRALMSKPELLLLDEPSAGLSPRYMSEVFEQVRTINAAGVGILMVEQNARQALAFATKGFVLANGANRFTGTGRELLDDPEVAKSFLGG